MSNSKLDKLNSWIRLGSKVTLNLLSTLVGESNCKTSFPQKLVLTDTQVLRLSKIFASNSSADLKL